jgi:phosphonate transport system substrate-binding protein
VAVDASSAGGYLYALGLFFEHGILKKDFSEITFMPGPGGQQEKVALAVYNGRAAEDSDYDTIRELAAKVGIDLDE